MIIFEKESKYLELNDLVNGEKSTDSPDTSWIMYNGGFICEEISFPKSSYYKFSIIAKGTHELGEWVRISCKIDKKLMMPRIIDSDRAVEYIFTGKVKAGKHKVSFSFEHNKQVETVELKSGNTVITPMSNTYMSGGFGIYTGKVTVSKITSDTVRTVPSPEYPTIQSAIDASLHGDEVVVSAGKYNEQIIIKNGVILRSDNSSDGDKLVEITVDDNIFISGHEADILKKKASKRTLGTIISGTGFPDYYNAKPMVAFEEGASEDTILDGFTIINMPEVDYANPNHVHTVQCRGSSPSIINNFIYNNGALGISAQASFTGRRKARELIKHDSNPIIANNIVYRNFGPGIGNDDYSGAVIFNNECAGNYSTGENEAPGIGIRNSSHPLVEGNLCHHNDHSGISSKNGKEDRTTTIRQNICYKNGLSIYDDSERNLNNGAGIGVDCAGSNKNRVVIEENICYENQMSGIGVKNNAEAIIRNNNAYKNKMAGIGINDTKSFVLVKGNIVCNNERSGIGCSGQANAILFNNMAYANLLAGITLDKAKQVKIFFNQTYRNKLAGIGIRNESFVESVKGNTIFENAAVGIGIDGLSKIGSISDNKIYDNQRPGIAVLSCSEIQAIENNSIANNGLSGAPNIVISGASNGSRAVKLRKNVISNNIYANIRIEKSDIFLEENVIAYSKNVGVIVTGSSTVNGIRNIIRHNSGSGITVKDSKLELYHTTLYNNAYRVGGGVISINSDVILKNNILSKNRLGIGGDLKPIDMDYNCFWESFVPPMYDIGFDSIEEDPAFVDENGNDFRLIQESPCIDRGKKMGNINENYLGNGPDIGAYEWDGTT